MSGTDNQGAGEQADQAAIAERAKAEASLVASFNASVLQSEAMLVQSGVPADRARDIAFARSILQLSDWSFAAWAVGGEPQPEIKRLAMIEAKDPEGNHSACIPVFLTGSIAMAESLRMPALGEGGFWVTISVPVAGVLEWVKSMKIPAVAIVNAANAGGPACVLGVDFIEWVRTMEAKHGVRPPGAG